MARKLRLQYPGAVYHVMSRGDRREAIFRDDKDCWRFLDTLAEACGRSGMRVHSYVLMGNHYHLLLETPEGNLVEGMRWLQGAYTQRFNSRHGESGHLFQGRYKAIPVDREDAEYFRLASDYIHLNPARARLLEAPRPRLGSYRWSSYRRLVGSGELPPWLERGRVFAAHGLPDESAASRRRFAAIMARKVAEVLGATDEEGERRRWAELRRGWMLGGESFRKRMERLVAPAMRGRRRASFVGEAPLRQHDRSEAERLLARIRGAWPGVEEVGRPANDTRKQAAAWLLRSRTTIGGAWIAEHLAMGHVSNVSRAYRAAQQVGERDDLRRGCEEIVRICKD
jgi:putative transposase